MRVLVIESERFFREQLCNELQQRGHDPVCCETTQLAWSRFGGESFPLVCLSLGASDEDGLQLCRRIRRHPHGQNCYIFVIAPRPRYHAAEEILGAGANDFLTLPIAAEQLSVRLSVAEHGAALIGRSWELRQEAGRRAHVNAALADLSQQLVSSSSLKEIAWLVLETGQRLTGSTAGCTCYIDTDTNRVICPAQQGVGTCLFRTNRPDPGDENCVRIWNWMREARQAVASNDTGSHQFFSRCPTGPLPQRLLYAPATVAGRMRGYILLAEPTVDYTNEDLFILQRVAETFALALHRRFSDQAQELSSRRQAVARLAQGIAHDYNNLLVGILGNAELLSDDLARHTEQAEMVRDIVIASKRAADLTRQILTYTQCGRHHPRRIESVQLVDATNLAHQVGLPVELQLETNLPVGLWDVYADPLQLRDALLRLVSNAAEAIAGRGRITVSLTNVRADECPPIPADFTLAAAGPHVRLAVTDTGQGMTDEVRAHAFEPFYTTRLPGQGLGLSVVWGVANEHNGFVTIESRPHEGTTIAVYLPALTEAMGMVAPDEEAPLDVAGTETLLIVDDDDFVRNTAGQVLTRLGYQVLLAYDGRHAIEVARSHAGPIDLILLDLAMPVMSGEQALPLLLEVRPKAKIVICSGYQAEACRDPLIGQYAHAFQPKPFQKQELAETVRRVLNGANLIPPELQARALFSVAGTETPMVAQPTQTVIPGA